MAQCCLWVTKGYDSNQDWELRHPQQPPFASFASHDPCPTTSENKQHSSEKERQHRQTGCTFGACQLPAHKMGGPGALPGEQVELLGDMFEGSYLPRRSKGQTCTPIPIPIPSPAPSPRKAPRGVADRRLGSRIGVWGPDSWNLPLKAVSPFRKKGQLRGAGGKTPKYILAVKSLKPKKTTRGVNWGVKRISPK